MHTISQLLAEKGTEVYSVGSSEAVYTAIEQMADKGIGALLVIDEGRLVGIVSERDYARKVILQGKSSRETPVAEIMTADVVTVDTHRSVDECLGMMTKHRIRHLPVVEEGQVRGMLSIGDLVRTKIEDQAQQIKSLEQYISG